jgi:hypothetical protein
MRGYKTRGNATRDNRGRAVPPPTYPNHPDRATRLVGLLAAGALGGLGGGLAVGFAAVGGSGLSVAAAHHDIPAATSPGLAARPEIRGIPGRVILTSAFSEALIAPLPSPSPSPTNPNKPAPTKSPSATSSPTPGDPNASAPSPSSSPSPSPTSTKSTSPGKTSTKGSGKGPGGNKNSGSNSGLGALDLSEAGAGQTPLVNVPGISAVDPSGLFPTVSPGPGSSPGSKGKRIEAVTTAATTPLDTLIPGQVVGLAVLVGAIGLAFVRFSLRTSPPSDSQEKSR